VPASNNSKCRIYTVKLACRPPLSVVTLLSSFVMNLKFCIQFQDVTSPSVNAHAHTHTHTHTHAHTRAHAHAHTHAHTHTHTHTCARTRTHAHTHARTHARTHMHAHTRTHTHTHTQARTHTHTHTHARTHTHTHTRTHTCWAASWPLGADCSYQFLPSAPGLSGTPHWSRQCRCGGHYLEGKMESYQHLGIYKPSSATVILTAQRV